MSGFDQAWLNEYQGRTGKGASVQAGVGSTVAAQIEKVMAQADPFATEPRAAAAPESVMLVLPYPISGNHYKVPRIVAEKGKPPFIMFYLTKEALDFKSTVQRRALEQGLARPLVGRIEVHVDLYPARPLDWEKRAAKNPMNWDDDVRCLDLMDNCSKVLMDALQGVAFENDRQIWRGQLERKEPDAHGARAVVRLSGIKRVDPRGSLF